MEVKKATPEYTGRSRSNLRTDGISRDFKSNVNFNTESIKGVDDIYGWYSKDNNKSEEKNATNAHKCVTSDNKIHLPENRPKLPSMEKRITCKSDETSPSVNPTAESSSMGSPKRSTFQSTEKIPLGFKKTTPVSTRNRNVIYQIYEWYNKDSKPNEENNNVEEKQTTFQNRMDSPVKGYELEKQISPSKSLQVGNPTTRTSITRSPGENYKPEACCRVSKDAIMELIEAYSIKDQPNEDFIDRLFKIETAFYDYLKLYVFKSKHLSRCSLFTFAWYIHDIEPSLRIYLDNLSSYYQDWKMYKYSLPTYGAAILSEDGSHVVMVQSSICKNSWGFPKGKVFRNEDAVSCAIREVREEIGFDIKDSIRADNYIEYQDSKDGRIVRMYIIEGVPIDTKFMINCKYEIKAIEWQPIEELMVSGGKIPINMSCKYLIQDLKNVKKNNFEKVEFS